MSQTQWIDRLSRPAVVGLDNEALLERAELLFESCLVELPESSRGRFLRQQLDLVTREGERRKLICWTLR